MIVTNWELTDGLGAMARTRQPALFEPRWRSVANETKRERNGRISQG
jgi:hypothetical protein